MAQPDVVPGQKVTYSEYRTWPEDRRVEVIDGEVFEMNAPLLPHQELAFALCRRLCEHFERAGGGKAWIAPADVVLSEHTVVQPDVLAVRTENLTIVKEAGVFGAPDLVIEVLSPSTSTRDAIRKRMLYERHGVREYWVVDAHERTLWQFSLQQQRLDLVAERRGTTEVESTAFPGLRLALATVWPEPLQRDD